LIRRIVFIFVLLSLSGPVDAQTRRGLQTYDTPYYTILTDIPPEQAREAALRMTKMAEEYQRRTRDFSGAIRHRFQFFLYRDEADYLAAGGMPNTDGLFANPVLIALAREEVGDATWYTIQHEGFHQFAQAVIGGVLPIWVNEGLADYFGEAVFTGDGFVSGVIPPWRLQRVRDRLERSEFKSIEQLLELSHRQWNQEMSLANYDQAWSLVQFLAHGDDGRYQLPFSRFMTLLSRGTPWPRAWQQSFGSADGLEQRWRDWWLSLPDHPTDDLYARAVTATLTSFLARAVSQKQSFDSFDAFARAAQAQPPAHHPQDWLPPALLEDALAHAEELRARGVTWELSNDPRTRLPRLLCTVPSSPALQGRFTLNGPRVRNVTVEPVP
jgi:hypothetical protein